MRPIRGGKYAEHIFDANVIALMCENAARMFEALRVRPKDSDAPAVKAKWNRAVQEMLDEISPVVEDEEATSTVGDELRKIRTYGR